MIGKGEIVLDVNESITVISGEFRIVVTCEECLETHKNCGHCRNIPDR